MNWAVDFPNRRLARGWVVNQGISENRLMTAADLGAGFTALAGLAHGSGLRIVAATIGPYAGAVYPGVVTPDGLVARREVNDWIRTAGVFAGVFVGVFDVARAVGNPDDPDFIRPDLDSGDGTHLNDKGAEAMTTPWTWTTSLHNRS